MAHRFALDHPEMLTHLSLLDIAPTSYAFRNGTPETSQGYWHWLFHCAGTCPSCWSGRISTPTLRYFFEQWTVQRHAVEGATDHYVTAFSRPGVLRAGFEDYRATIPDDLAHDPRDHEAGMVVGIPTQVLRGEQGLAASMDVLEVWRPYAPEVTGQPVPNCGRFLPEEQPQLLTELLLPYLNS